MKPAGNARITLTVTQQQAEMMGIVFCECGHRPNNHFDSGKQVCAHCPPGECKGYKQHISIRTNDGYIQIACRVRR